MTTVPNAKVFPITTQINERDHLVVGGSDLVDLEPAIAEMKRQIRTHGDGSVIASDEDPLSRVTHA